MVLSIVIPVYNVAQYLRECLDSVLSQTIGDWEAICVDDGSTDDSGRILDEYSVRDSRFKVVHLLTNLGVSAARQSGLEEATGKYLGFVDPDDWIDPQMFATLVKAAEASSADYVWEDFRADSAHGAGKSGGTQYCDCFKIIDSLLTGKTLASLCVRLFRLQFIREHGITFLSGRIRVCEDLCFICEVLSKHPRCLYVNQSHYHYRDVSGSITHSMNNETIESWRVVCRRLGDVLTGTPAENSLKIFIRGCRLSTFLNNWVSDELFYGFLPEEKSARGTSAPLLHKILFWLSAHGMRGGIMKMVGIARRIKWLMGMQTQI